MERCDTGGSSFTDFLIRRAENLFYSAWGMFILALCLENAANYLMMQKYDGFLLSSCRTLYEILFILFVILFPVGIAFYLRKKSFALWWIMLLLSSLIWSISDVVGFQNPLLHGHSFAAKKHLIGTKIFVNIISVIINKVINNEKFSNITSIAYVYISLLSLFSKFFLINNKTISSAIFLILSKSVLKMICHIKIAKLDFTNLAIYFFKFTIIINF